jgi:hypothetical protein
MITTGPALCISILKYFLIPGAHSIVTVKIGFQRELLAPTEHLDRYKSK